MGDNHRKKTAPPHRTHTHTHARYNKIYHLRWGRRRRRRVCNLFKSSTFKYRTRFVCVRCDETQTRTFIWSHKEAHQRLTTTTWNNPIYPSAASLCVLLLHIPSSSLHAPLYIVVLFRTYIYMYILI